MHTLCDKLSWWPFDTDVVEKDIDDRIWSKVLEPRPLPATERPLPRPCLFFGSSKFGFRSMASVFFIFPSVAPWTLVINKKISVIVGKGDSIH